METYYIKKGKKFIPMGVLPSSEIPYGIWYVRRNEHSTSYTNVVAFGQVELIDIKKTVSQIDLTDKICDVLLQLNKEGAIGYQYIPYQDIAKRIAKEIYK